MTSREESNDIVVEVRAQPRLLQSLRALVRGYMTSLGIAKDKVDELVLAVDEACCNSIRHAYGSDPKRVFTLILRSDEHAVELELRDTGKPAAADRIRPRELDVPSLDELTPGGLGMPLIYKTFDHVEFVPGETRGNRLVMRFDRKDRTADVPND